MKNQVQLITYADRLSGGNMRDLHGLLTGSLKNVFGGVHILPFFYPIDGSDAGFDPIDHTQVDPKLGNWADVAEMTKDIEVMADVIANHMSSNSPQFQDFSEKGSNSVYNGLFLTMDAVFPNGATEKDLLTVYRPRPGLPFTYATLKNGERKLLWTTFTSQQVDINVKHPQGKKYLESILQTFNKNGIRMIRLDAVGYAIKKAGDNCFMMPETFDFIDEFTALAHSLDIEVLLEIHSYYRKQIEIAKCVDYVYDFALPPLILHAFFNKTSQYLKEWIAIRPNNSLTVLDTHDGIGIIDIGADAADRVNRPGLVPPADLDRLVETIHEKSGGQSRKATGAAASNLDLYQVNCTFYDAMGRNNREYLLARAIQYFMPGIPQVYYTGLLAGENDMELLARTAVGRDINRHYYTKEEVERDLKKPVVQDLIALTKLRNTHPGFNGSFTCIDKGHDNLVMRWESANDFVQLSITFSSTQYSIEYSEQGATKSLVFSV